MTRAAVLIDGANLPHAQRAFRAKRLDLKAMSDELAAGHERFRSYYYHSLPFADPDHAAPRDLALRAAKQRFFDSVSFLERFEVRLGNLQRFTTRNDRGEVVVRHRQKLVDVLLSVDMVQLAWSGRVDLVVLLAGDSDFVPAVRATKEAGAAVRLVYTERDRCFVHRNLKLHCDERLELTEAHMSRWSLPDPSSTGKARP